MVVGVAGAMAVMVRNSLPPLAVRVGISQETVRVVGLYVALSEPLTKVKPGGRIS